MHNIAQFRRSLLDWYRNHARDLPWRRTNDPYKIWISEVMLQQTTVNTVIPFYKKWVKEFPNVEKVANAKIQKILKYWQGLGYYSRARNIHKSAQIICEKFNAKVPANPEDLKQLPGFGPYTVGAVLSIAYNKRFPIIDANIRRVIMRIEGIKGIASSKVDPSINRILGELLPTKDISTFNQALMELGALICRSRNPLCVQCPLRRDCRSYKLGIQEIVAQQKGKLIEEIDVVIGLIKKNNKFLIQQRPNRGLLADLWEFPGGKIEKGELPKDALARELKEEVGVELVDAKRYITLRHFYTNFKVNLDVYACQVNSYPASTKSRRWISYSDFAHFPMPSGSAKIVDNLKVKCYPY